MYIYGQTWYDVPMTNIYSDALAVIHTYGWARKELNTPDGCVCAAGAVAVLVGEDMPYEYSYSVTVHEDLARTPIQAALGEVAAELFPDRVDAPEDDGYFPHGTTAQEQLVQFNDHPDTTLADVELVFTTAAKRNG